VHTAIDLRIEFVKAACIEAITRDVPKSRVTNSYNFHHSNQDLILCINSLRVGWVRHHGEAIYSGTILPFPGLLHPSHYQIRARVQLVISLSVPERTIYRPPGDVSLPGPLSDGSTLILAERQV
jgi:hypothetical protein